MRLVDGPDALFEPDGDTFVPTELARGPWSPDSLHGGPVAALIGGCLESTAGGDGLALRRLSLEIVRPVPVEPLRVETRVSRPGRRVRLVEAVLTTAAERTELCRAVGLELREADVPLPDGVGTSAGPAGPAAGTPMTGDWGWRAFHNAGMEIRFVHGRFETPGPATAWFRLRQPVVAGQHISPFQRVAAAGDFGNGIGAALPFEGWLFINPDLTLTTHRPPAGEWVCLESRTFLDHDGAGFAESALYDETGRIGRAVQTLLVDHR